MRAVLALGLIAGLLLMWERRLASSAAVDRIERTRVGFPIPPETRKTLPIAAVRIELDAKAQPQRSFLFGRSKGLWRCLDFHQALASEAAILGLAEKLTRTEGWIRSRDGEDAEVYGIGTPETLRVYLCGKDVLKDPQGDVIEAFEIGHSLPDRDACFIRRRGHPEIWALDADVRAILEARVAPTLPPLIEPNVVPGFWPGWEKGLVRIFVDRGGADGSGDYELRREEVQRTPEELQQGISPYVWRLNPDEEDAVDAGALQANAYSLFVRATPFVDLLDPARQGEFGFDAPRTIVTLVPREGEPLLVGLGAPRKEGVPVWVPSISSLLMVTPEVAQLLAPPSRIFREGGQANPWDPYLRR